MTQSHEETCYSKGNLKLDMDRLHVSDTRREPTMRAGGRTSNGRQGLTQAWQASQARQASSHNDNDRSFDDPLDFLHVVDAVGIEEP
jgi:hypothetical protein